MLDNLRLSHKLTLYSSLKFPEETEGDLFSVTIDDPFHHHLHLNLSSDVESQQSVFSAPATPTVFSPTLPFQHDDIRRDEASSSSSEDSEKEDEFERERLPGYRRPL